jgi:3',5'-cyclic AMP phosphodiesterase CpdA
MAAPFTDEQIAHRLLIIAKHNGDMIAAGNELGIKYPSLREWYHRLPSWRKPGSPDFKPSAAPAPPTPKEPEEPLAVRQERRLKDEIARLRGELNRANRDLNDAEDLRHAVFGLAAPVDPADHAINLKPKQATAEAALLFQSDEQWGEVIAAEEVGGLNAYNRHIASARLRRLIETTIRCCLPPYSVAPPPVFYYCMGGDSLSGSIHEELAETNDLSSIPAIMDYCANVRWAIETLRDTLGCPIVVIRVPGNHDRTTHKPRHKKYNETSLDTIISWHLETTFKGDEQVTFLIPRENDAYFDVLGWKFLLSHGDMMGTGGGTGYIGPVASITKGHRKLAENYNDIGKRVDYVLTGHYHTAVETEYGFGNGSLPGYSEYARLKIRARPAPPVQWLLHIHPEHGVTTRRKINVGAPGEGLLYERGRA